MAVKTYSVTNNWTAPIELPVFGSLRVRKIDPGETVTDAFVLTNRPHILRWIRTKLIRIVEVVGDDLYIYLVDENDDFLVDENDNFLVTT